MPTQAFEIIQLAIATNTLGTINGKHLIEENPGLACEGDKGETLLNYACRQLFVLLPSDEVCKTGKYGFFQGYNYTVLEERLKKISEIRNIAIHLLRAGAIPTQTDKMYFMSVLSRFTNQTAFSSTFFCKVLDDFSDLTREFINHGFNQTLININPHQPVTSRMKAEELSAYIQSVKQDSRDDYSAVRLETS